MFILRIKKLLRAILVALFFVSSLSNSLSAILEIPAFTAYIDPDANGARVSATDGLRDWRDPANKVLWFGELRAIGDLEVALKVHLPATAQSTLQLTLDGQTHQAIVSGEAGSTVSVSFGSFKISAPGYQKLSLGLLNQKEEFKGQILALLLSGPASENAHFNLKPRRNAASVHLMYPIPNQEQAAAFYCEATAHEDPVWTYYMACGWHRGYFGMQVNSPAERRIIFSVWDSGNEPTARDKVATADRVALIAKGEGVVAGDFGNEGTGGHSHLVYPWKTGETQRFLVTAKTNDLTHTTYSGYYYHPEKKQWVLISSWKAPKEGGYMRGLYSFNEDFGGANGHLRRKALFGNQFIRNSSGKWIELTKAKFSHDGTGKEDRLDRFMGVENGQFFLSNGGFVSGFTKYGELFERPAKAQPPVDLMFIDSN